MKYQEKIQLAEKGIEFLSTGKSINEYEENLLKEGYYNYDVNKVISSIKNILYDKYGKEIKELLIKDKLVENRNKFSNLNDSILEIIKKREINNIINDSKRKVRDLLYDSVEPNLIAKEIENRFFSSDDIIAYIKKYKEENEIVSSKGKSNNIALGIVIAVIGIVLSMSTTRLFYGAIIVGIAMIIKGMSVEDR